MVNQSWKPIKLKHLFKVQGQAFDDTYNGPKLALPETLRVEYGIGWKSKHLLIWASQSFKIAFNIRIKFELFITKIRVGKVRIGNHKETHSDRTQVVRDTAVITNRQSIACTFLLSRKFSLFSSFFKNFISHIFWKTAKSKLTETQRLAHAQRTKARWVSIPVTPPIQQYDFLFWKCMVILIHDINTNLK